MISQMSNISIGTNEALRDGAPSMLAGQMAGAGFDLEECASISDVEFRLLMTLIVAATFAFGCIVNGWLL